MGLCSIAMLIDRRVASKGFGCQIFNLIGYKQPLLGDCCMRMRSAIPSVSTLLSLRIHGVSLENGASMESAPNLKERL